MDKILRRLMSERISDKRNKKEKKKLFATEMNKLLSMLKDEAFLHRHEPQSY